MAQSNNNTMTESNDDNNTGAIVGAVLGTVLLLGIAAVMYARTRRTERSPRMTSIRTGEVPEDLDLASAFPRPSTPPVIPQGQLQTALDPFEVDRFEVDRFEEQIRELEPGAKQTYQQIYGFKEIKISKHDAGARSPVEVVDNVVGIISVFITGAQKAIYAIREPAPSMLELELVGYKQPFVRINVDETFWLWKEREQNDDERRKECEFIFPRDFSDKDKRNIAKVLNHQATRSAYFSNGIHIDEIDMTIPLHIRW